MNYFSVGFFLLFIFLHFLHHSSIKSVVCPVWSLFENQHYCGNHSQPWSKIYRDQLVTEKGDLYEKDPISAISGAKTQI